MPTYACPFCNTVIAPAKKTEIFYRNIWVKGCADCYLQSINPKTQRSFQLIEIATF